MTTAPSRRASGGAEAEVGAVPEGHVAVHVPGDVEAVGIGVLPLVPTRRAVEQGHLRARRDGDAVEVDIPGDVARLDRRRGFVPEQLLDRVGEQRPVRVQLRPLLGVSGEEHRRPAEEAGGRLAPGALQQDEEALHLHRFEAAAWCRRGG